MVDPLLLERELDEAKAKQEIADQQKVVREDADDLQRAFAGKDAIAAVAPDPKTKKLLVEQSRLARNETNEFKRKLLTTQQGSCFEIELEEGSWEQYLDPAAVAVGSNPLHVMVGLEQIFSRATEGVYPGYLRVLPYNLASRKHLSFAAGAGPFACCTEK